MKKVIVITLLILGIITPVYAKNVSYDTFISADDVTLERLNNNFNTLVNNLNTIPGENLESSSVSADALTSNADPQKRWADTFSNFVVTGLLAPTSATLTSTTTAGRALITNTSANEMKYVQKDATAKTYTAGKWTYVDLDDAGTYTYSETTQGAAEPSVTSNSIRLFRVSADNSSGVGTVTDLRVIGASFTNEDFYITGMELEVVSPDNMVTVDAGVCYHGSTRVEKTAQTGLRHRVATDWWDGAVDTYASAGWNYVAIDSSGNIKFIGTNAPDKADTDENTVGTLRYWDDGTELWRVLGAARINTSDAIDSSLFQRGDKVMWDAPPNMTTTVSDNAWSSALDCSAGIPAISRMALFGLFSTETGGTTTGIWIRPDGSNWAGGEENGIKVLGGTNALISGQRWCATDSSQEIQYFNNTSDSSTTIDVEGFILDIRH